MIPSTMQTAIAPVATPMDVGVDCLVCDLATPCRGREPGIKITVILPVFNEARSIGHAIDSVLDFAERHRSHQFVFVDDGSLDGTPQSLADRLGGGVIPNVSWIGHPTNRGKADAIRSALAHCDSEAVCFLDGDLAYSLDHLPFLEAALDTADIAIGCRMLAKPWGWRGAPCRWVLSRAFNLLVRLVLGLPYRDTQAGLKAFRSPVLRRLLRHQRIRGPGFDAEILFLARKFHYTVAETPARVAAAHNYKTISFPLLLTAFRMMLEILLVRYYDCLHRYKTAIAAEF